MHLNQRFNNKTAMSTREKEALEEIEIYVNVTITNETLEQAASKENVQVTKNSNASSAIGRPPNQFILFRIKLAKCLKNWGYKLNARDESKIISNIWKKLPQNVYNATGILQAYHLHCHKLMYPGYKYKLGPYKNKSRETTKLDAFNRTLNSYENTRKLLDPYWHNCYMQFGSTSVFFDTPPVLYSNTTTNLEYNL